MTDPGTRIHYEFAGFRLDTQQRLLLSVHHLAVDAVSWRVLLEDLESTYLQLERGEPVALPAKSTSFQAWARRLESHARSEALDTEVGRFWEDEARRRVSPGTAGVWCPPASTRRTNRPGRCIAAV